MNAAASFLVLVPLDPTMNSNMQFYEEEEGANKYTIQPMKEVEEYQKRKDMEYKLLQFAKMRFWGEEDKEVNKEGGEGKNETAGVSEGVGSEGLSPDKEGLVEVQIDSEEKTTGKIGEN